MLLRIVVALGVAVILGLGIRHPQDPLDQRDVARICEASYLMVRTAADTAIVDSQAPVVDPELPSPKVTCGELRMGGRLGTGGPRPLPPNER